MINTQVFVLILTILFSQVILGQDAELVELESKVDTIPFELTSHNNIAIKVILNQKDTLVLMFHTGVTDLSLTSESTEKLKTIKWNSSESVNSWGGESDARFSMTNELKIENLEWDSIAIWESRHSGPGTDGKFGPNLFSDMYIEVDFETQDLILHSATPSKLNVYEKLPLDNKNGLLFIAGKSKINGVEINNHFLIHSGYAGAILFDDEFVNTNGISDHIEITDEQELKDSYGNIIKTKKGKIENFSIGDIDLKEIPVGFFEGTVGRQKMSVIGGDVLKRFNLVIDSKREYIYVKSNNLIETPYVSG